MSSLEQRLAELEIRQAFQDDSLQQLSDIVASQQREIELLRRQLQELHKRQQEQSSQSPSGDEVPPPHY